MERRGTATLPLHGGSAPPWLFDRMVDLGGAIAEAVVAEYGHRELLERLADPHWFQALGCVLGFDWHSSGVTTTTMGALKEALDPETHGVVVAGGKGGTSRRTPDEVGEAAGPLGVGGGRVRDLQRASRLAAKVDNACVQDAYTIYHHTMAVTVDGEWCVVQQGMDDETARRYHWLSTDVDAFVAEPHSAVCAQVRRDEVRDLTADASGEARAVAVDLVQDDPAHLMRHVTGQRSLAEFGVGSGPSPSTGTAGAADLRMPAHHDLRPSDLTERSIEQLQVAYEYQPDDFEELVGIRGIGPGSLRALSLIAEVVHDADTAREDPAKYAYAHGGKDGTPHPVKRERYDRSVAFMRSVLESADADADTRQAALDRLAAIA